MAAGQINASAAPGDTAHAEGKFLSGTLLGSNLAAVADLQGETASSDGTSPEANSGTLALGVLGAQVLTLNGGIQVPLDLTNAGVVGQYASASDNGSSFGSSGLIQSDGTIGTGTAAPGVTPGPLSLSLSSAVADLGLNPALLSELASLQLEVDAVSASASLTAPGSPVGEYSIDGLRLRFQSPTVAALSADLSSTVASVQTAVDGLEPALDADLSTVLGPLSGLVNVNVAVTTPDLSAAVDGLLAGTISDPATGVGIDLSTGEIVLDLDTILELNGLPVGTDILTAATINTITGNLSALLTSQLDLVETTLATAVDGIAITGGATVLGANILTLDTTVGEIRTGDTSGIALLGIGAGLGGGVSAILSSLLTPVAGVADLVDGVSADLLAPVTSGLFAAIGPVLENTVRLTVNNQTTAGGEFTETALRVTVLPSLPGALALDIANGTVGPNALADHTSQQHGFQVDRA